MNGWTIFDALGGIGSILVIVAYLATQTGRLALNDWRYPFANMVGAALILVSLATAWNFSAFLMEIFWLFISLYGVIRAWPGRKA